MEADMKSPIFFDTTLRDGEQAPGNAMSQEQKIDIFHHIDMTGIDYIEVGFPSSSPADFAVTRKLAHSPRKAKVCAFAIATEEDIATAVNALDGAADSQVQILLTGSEIHAEHKRRMPLDALLRETDEAVTFAGKKGVRDISVALEDATRGSPEFLRPMVEQAIAAGATTLVIPDTVGAMIPKEYAGLIAAIRSWVGEKIKVIAHCHNDLGLAAANSIAALEAGADGMQTTFCGIGERAGNTAIEEIYAILHYKYPQISLHLDPKAIAAACRHIEESVGLKIGHHKPIIGRYVFATAAGLHINGLTKKNITYEFVSPELFGRKSELVIGRVSGRTAVRNKLEKLAIPHDDDLVNRVYQEITTAENRLDFNDDDTFRALVARLLAPRSLSA